MELHGHNTTPDNIINGRSTFQPRVGEIILVFSNFLGLMVRTSRLDAVAFGEGVPAQDICPIRSDRFRGLQGRKRYFGRNHNCAPFLGNFKLCIRVAALEVTLQTPLALQTTVDDHLGEFLDECRVLRQIGAFRRGIFVGLQMTELVDEVVKAVKGWYVWEKHWTHNLKIGNRRTSEGSEDHNFVIDRVEMFVDEADIDSEGQGVFAEEGTEVVAVFMMFVDVGNVMNCRKAVVLARRDEASFEHGHDCRKVWDSR